MRPSDWNGDPDCPKCLGRGVVSVDYMGFPGGATHPCDCRYEQEVRANTDRIWKGLSRARPIAESPLLDMTDLDVIITAPLQEFRRHLRHVAFRKGPRWDARVVSDSALAQAWLATKVDVFDADVLAQRDRKKVVSEDYVTLVDIAVPFDLLIIQLGVKAAKNREMPGVLLEVLHERDHRDLPTWLVDTPRNPLREGHICWDTRIEDMILEWDTVTLAGDGLDYDADKGGEQHFDMGSPVEEDVLEAPRGYVETSEQSLENEDWMEGLKLTRDTSHKSPKRRKMRSPR
jgi:hypothetical protein